MAQVKLYFGDCVEILKEMPSNSVDAIITDPPYPNLKGGLRHTVGGVCPRTQPTITIGTPWGNDIGVLREFERIARYGAIVFCSWHAIGEIRDILGGDAVGLVTWYKRNSQMSFRNRPHYTCEHAWLIEYAPGMNWKPIETMYDIPGLQAGCFATERVLDGTGKALHPAQKPELLMRLLVKACNLSVLDPFMGLGTTGVACVQMGKDFIGIEKERKFFDVAKERIENTALQPLLHTLKPQQAKLNI